MLGYTKYDGGPEIIAKTLGWFCLFGVAFGIYLIYAGFTTMLARDGELIGQAKKLTLVTPFWSSICPEYYALDVSLGVMQNGTGSMSTQDVWFTIKNVQDLDLMRKAVENASIAKIKYDTRRLAACTETHYATGFQIVR